jgi:SAM-dependent methyltransferase
MNSTERFSDRADDYRRYRPSYPLAVINLIRDTCSLQAGAPVADIGSGTGILTKLLLKAGFDVTAVEPNQPMRVVAEEDLLHFPRFHSVSATAEQTGLPTASFDVITVAQAFHWFDHVAARQEFQRLLRPDGWIFLIWNDGNTDSSPFISDYEAFLKPLRESRETTTHWDKKARTLRMEEFFPHGSLRVAQFDNPQIMDWPALRGRFLSASYAPADGDPRHQDYLARLEHIFHKHATDGKVTFDQRTKVYYGRLMQEAH